MRRIFSVAACTWVAALVATITPSLAQGRNIRGTIAAVDGNALTVKTNAGDTLIVDVPDTARLSITKPFSIADVKQGMMLGVTTVKRGDGTVEAIDVRPIPATAKQGLSAYDLAPQSTMTNAVLEASVAASGAHKLTLNYGSGTVDVVVTDKTAMSRAEPGARADLKAGETVYAFAEKGEGDKLTAVRVQVSKDGVKPTQ